MRRLLAIIVIFTLTGAVALGAALYGMHAVHEASLVANDDRTSSPGVADATTTPPPAPAAPIEQPIATVAVRFPSALQRFSTCLEQWDYAATLEATIAAAADLEIDTTTHQTQLDQLNNALDTCKGAGTDAASDPAARAQCPAARTRAAIAQQRLALPAALGAEGHATRNALAELNGFLALAC